MDPWFSSLLVAATFFGVKNHKSNISLSRKSWYKLWKYLVDWVICSPFNKCMCLLHTNKGTIVDKKREIAGSHRKSHCAWQSSSFPPFQLSIFGCYFLNHILYDCSNIIQPTSTNYIKLSSVSYYLLDESPIVVFVCICNFVMWCRGTQWWRYL